MNLSTYETITVSERVAPIYPGLSQVDLDIVSGHIYRLTFDATISTGILKVYQGTQLIYDTTYVPIGIISDIIHVTERITLDRRTSFINFDSVTLSENITLSIYYPCSVSDSVTVSEAKTITII